MEWVDGMDSGVRHESSGGSLVFRTPDFVSHEYRDEPSRSESKRVKRAEGTAK